MIRKLLTVVSCLGLFIGVATAMEADIGTAFTYQGSLENASGPVTDICAFRFGLWDSAAGGNQVGASLQTASLVEVTDGVFTVTLDFGAGAIDGAARWLAIEVQCTADGAFVPLDSQRVALTPAPHAIRAVHGVGGPNALNVDSSGNVGVGTTSTTDKLAVLGNTLLSGVLRIASPTTTVAGQADITIDPTNESTIAFPGGQTVSFPTQGGMTVAMPTGQTVSFPPEGGVDVSDPNTGTAVSFPSQGGITITFPTGSVTFPSGQGPVQIGFDNDSIFAIDPIGAVFMTPPGGIEPTIGLDASTGSILITAPGGGDTLQIGSVGLQFPDGSVLSTAPGVSSPLPLAQLATLRWDLAQGNYVVGTIAAGDEPLAVAFDGANFWVPSFNSDNVTRRRAFDGAYLGTFPVGDGPNGVAFDGANIWIANHNSDNVTKLRASDGAILGTFAAGDGPSGVAFDGANIWVTNYLSDNVNKLRKSDGANLGTFAVGDEPLGVAFDGSNIWVANHANDNVTKLRASDGANLGTFAAGDGPYGVAFDGANIWVSNYYTDNVTKLWASDGANLGTFAAGDAPVAVAFDGADIWVANSLSDNVTKLQVSDGANLGTFSAGDGPYGVAFDGANIWVPNRDSDNVTRIFVGGNLGVIREHITGNVGIGDTTPDARLDVEASSATVAAFNRQTNDGTVISIQQGGIEEGTISVSGTTVSYNAFTGSHNGWTDAAIARGTLITLTGENRRRTEDPGAEPMYGIAPSNKANDPKCLGAYLGLLEPSKASAMENPHQIMAVGNGDMWVVDTGRNIEPGQYIISSDVKGHAMLDNAERFAVGYVVARAGEGVDWAKVSETVDGRKHKRISVFFESFERGSAVGVGKIVEEQQKRIDELSRRLSELEAAKGSAQ